MRKNYFKAVALLLAAVSLFLAGCKDSGQPATADSGKESSQTDAFGTVEKETVALSIAKFNTQIMDNGLEYPLSDDYALTENELYWYGVREGLNCYIKPESFTGNKENDITETIGIRYQEGGDPAIALSYLKCLIRANRPDMTDSEINTLISDAEKSAADGFTANNGKGISVGILDYEGGTEYQVIRLY